MSLLSREALSFPLKCHYGCIVVRVGDRWGDGSAGRMEVGAGIPRGLNGVLTVRFRLFDTKLLLLASEEKNLQKMCTIERYRRRVRPSAIDRFSHREFSKMACFLSGSLSLRFHFRRRTSARSPQNQRDFSGVLMG